jgi:hypothetical protein
MRFLASLVLLSALAIAGCAAYFSIVGLTLLFVGSGTSIIVMGIALEVGKIITVTFLKQRWEAISLSLKTYLIIATLVLMLITSIGIYGYLSAGYNATAVKVQGYEQVVEGNNKRIQELKEDNIKLSKDPANDKEIEIIRIGNTTFDLQQVNLISQKEAKIKELRSNNNADIKSTGDLVAAKASLDAEKTSLDTAVNRELEQIKLYNSRLEILDKEVQSWLTQGDRGLFKKNGGDKARETKALQEKERSQIDAQIKECQGRMDTLRNDYKEQVKLYNLRLTAVESRLGGQDNTRLTAIKELEDQIKEIQADIIKNDKKTEDRVAEQIAKKEETIRHNKDQTMVNELAIQKLLVDNSDYKEKIVHTDVGTFKFVAKSLGMTLDLTVTYFIWAIMLVFDPLAVCLILCFNYLIQEIPSKKKELIPEPIEPEPTPTPFMANTSSEIISGVRLPKPVVTPTQEAARLAKILEDQRAERAARKAKV